MFLLILSLLLGLPLVFTVARAIQNGSTWFDVISAFSQLFNWWLGGDIKDTLSCRTAMETFTGNSPKIFWRSLHIFLDLIARPFEKDHCIERMLAANAAAKK